MSYQNVYSVNPYYLSRFIVTEKKYRYNQDLSKVYTNQVKNISLENLNKGFKKGKGLSKQSIRKIKEALGWLEFIALPKIYTTKKGKKIKFKIQMITLTLSGKQKHTDKYITSKMLGKFLNNLRNNYNLRNYIWRAERQKNGNLHYHIVTDCGIGYFTVLKIWNKIQEKEGYLEEYRKKYKKDYPNSVDILRMDINKGGADYIAKYNTKELEAGQTIDGRFYSLSESLSKFDVFKRETRDIANALSSSFLIKPEEWVNINDFVAVYPIRIKRLTTVGELSFTNQLLRDKLGEICGLYPSNIIGNWTKAGTQIELI